MPCVSLKYRSTGFFTINNNNNVSTSVSYTRFLINVFFPSLLSLRLEYVVPVVTCRIQYDGVGDCIAYSPFTA